MEKLLELTRGYESADIWNMDDVSCVFKSQKQSSEGVIKSLTKFTGKYLCRSRFFNKVAGLRAGTLLKNRPWHSCFPVDFVELLRTPFFI